MRTKDRVESILKHVPITRSSDKRLLLSYWHKQGLYLTKEQEQVFMSKCTTAETITRARRSLKGQYPAVKEVNEKRFSLFNRYRSGDIL
jgi:hypothetical protein